MQRISASKIRTLHLRDLLQRSAASLCSREVRYTFRKVSEMHTKSSWTLGSLAAGLWSLNAEQSKERRTGCRQSPAASLCAAEMQQFSRDLSELLQIGEMQQRSPASLLQRRKAKRVSAGEMQRVSECIASLLGDSQTKAMSKTRPESTTYVSENI
jgi:hypothetical protein